MGKFGAGTAAVVALALLSASARASESLEERVRRLEEQLASAEKEAQAQTFRAYWKDGLRLDTADKAFQLRMGGRVVNDWAFMVQDHALEEAVGTDLDDGTEFRKARLYVKGVIYKHVEFKGQYDFAGGHPNFKDVYVGLTGLTGLGGIRVGHFKEPFSLEQITSGNYITFMERALPNAFAPERNTGVMLHSQAWGGRLTWAVGAFKDTDAFGDRKGEADFNFTGRLTGLPWYEDEGRSLLHLGVAYSHRDPNEETAAFSAEPEAHLAPELVKTGDFPADNVHLLGAEGALVRGPLSLQGEYVRAFATTVGPGRDLSFGGWYVYASYFLTGEHRPYKTSSGAFDMLRPRHDYLFGEGGRGPGAWEVAVRYSEADMNDEAVSGGGLNDFTFGLNWYLNPNARVMFNYVLGDLDRAGEAHIFQMRFQVFI